MIAVIADDLTGAAELGGIGLSHGLNVEISTVVNVSSEADLLIIATDTRSGSQDQAITDMIAVTKKIAEMQPTLIFKKVDSVLRGYVIPEIKAQLEVLGFEKALLVPANPALGRTIEKGEYLINGAPISKTAFSADPEFPATSSDVLQLLKADSTVQVRKHADGNLEKGITIGEVTSESDLNGWAKLNNEDVLLAGAAGFFKAILNNSGFSKLKSEQSHEVINGTRLYVFGSAFSKSIELVQKLSSQGEPVCYLPETLINNITNEKELESYCDEICNLINRAGKAIIAIDSLKTISANALELRMQMASVVTRVFAKVKIKELIIEGGSTASAILKSLEIETLKPINEYAAGVIRSKVIGKENLYITLKPGSYNWPNQVLKF